jgi:hypothetical protein
MGLNMAYAREPGGWRPDRIEDGYLSWSIPSHMWERTEYGDDTIKISLDVAAGEWTAVTEFNQNVSRDLDDEDVLSIRRQYGLDAWVSYFHPDFDLGSVPAP